MVYHINSKQCAKVCLRIILDKEKFMKTFWGGFVHAKGNWSSSDRNEQLIVPGPENDVQQASKRVREVKMSIGESYIGRKTSRDDIDQVGLITPDDPEIAIDDVKYAIEQRNTYASALYKGRITFRGYQTAAATPIRPLSI